MQRPAEMAWSQPRCLGEVPSRRSGHSFDAVGDFAYLFGGIDSQRPPGPNNHLHKVDISGSDFYWTKLKQEGRVPAPRVHHSTVVKDNSIILFGGFHNTGVRYNDVWILNTANDTWSQPPQGYSEIGADGLVHFKRAWPNVPAPRGGHSAVLIENRMWVFGGYGGTGFARRDFDELSYLDLETFEWKPVTTNGELPEARSGHQAVGILNKMYVFGGWNSVQQLDNVYIFDSETFTWSKAATASGPDSFGAPRWNFSAIAVFAVPYWKVFVFGGDSGELTGDGNPQGSYLNDMMVLEAGTDQWSQPQVIGEPPSPRSDSPIVYDQPRGRMLVFGGWCNRWFGDMHSCYVADVVGPPYSIESISPEIGPLTGDTQCTIKGLGFTSSQGAVTLRFACMKGYLEVAGTVVDDCTITATTPSFEKYGPAKAECRVSLGGKSLTNSVVDYLFFAVTNARRTVAFGPGLLSGFAAGFEVSFIIQAQDSNSNNRICGMDVFLVTVSPTAANSSPLPVQVADQNDGTYLVKYTAPSEGEYDIQVEFEGTFRGVAGPIRGSPFRVRAVSGADPALNQLDGQLLTDHIRDQTKAAKEFSMSTLKGLKKPIPRDDLDSVIRVKDHLKSVETRHEALEIQADSNRAALLYLKKEGGSVDKMIDALDNTQQLWGDVNRQVPLTNASIVSLVKAWSVTVSNQIDQYCQEMAERLKSFQKQDFWSAGVTPTEARELITKQEKAMKDQRKHLDENTQLCSTFDILQLLTPAVAVFNEMTDNLVQLRQVWEVTEQLAAFQVSAEALLWKELNLNTLEEEAKQQMKAVKGLHKSMRWCEAFKHVDKSAKDFLNTIPLITLLGDPSMRPRHWKLLRTATKKEFVSPHDDENMQLGDILRLHLHEFTADVEEICDQAMKEAKMEKQLLGIAERWIGIEWIMDLYADTDVPLLKMSEEDFEVLESDQLMIQSMLASRYVKQFADQVNDWQVKLTAVSDVFTILQDIQRTWSYLEPLFIRSEEVKRELPEDAKRFQGIDGNVRKELSRAWEIRNIRDACNQDGLLKRLEGIESQLEICKKSLADFLDGRRRQFPRYYFTSEADLLDILSNGSTPSKVLKHTSKVYLATKTLVLSTDKTPNGRPYAEKFVAEVGVEELAFEPRVPLEGKVEIYMQTVLDAMKVTLFEHLKRSLARYPTLKRTDWLMHQTDGRPTDASQVMLLTLAVNYVNEVEQTFSKLASNPNALVEYNQRQVDQLNELIRLTQCQLAKADRTRVMVAITMDAHARDIVQKMVREGVTDVSSFQWQSQLKHKFRIPPSHASSQGKDPHLRGPKGERAEVAICDAILPYDYEYLGNGPRLVITPLTDRIYVTATQALNLKMGCAPAGPAGTGKTETTKDLASALAKCCYVFNCSPEMDYQGLGNIFKGLASSGSWGCFDEFNRLIPEVLSVCSVQFKAVCDGTRAEIARIVIEGDEISLDPTCGAFITMNPGYLGRSELPEGLKALFRPITVMVPDLVLICENMLMAEGFVQAKLLASKFYGLYSLLRELLSKQMHYDWGLRAVKSVLVVAGGFKRAEPDLAEDALLMRALRDFNIPKIVREDEVVFFGLLGDLFPGLDPPRKVDTSLEEYVEAACTNVGNWPDEQFRLKVVQLEELLNIRHCVFVMGPPGCGKTQCWKTLAEARKLRGEPTKFVDINPKAVKTEELYGFISMATRDWKDGLLSNVMRELGKIPDEKSKWIILDGDLDANWIESMNSVMDDNKMLTLASNERIPLKHYMRMIFEIRDLRFATPATVSRAGILYISTDDGTQWRSLINSWLANLKQDEEVIEHLRYCFDSYVHASLRWLKKHAKMILPLQDMNLVQSLLYMLDGCLKTHAFTAETIAKAFVFCTIWAMGSALTVADDGTDYRKLFSDWWRSEWREVKLPTQYTIFDYWYDPKANTFDLWSKSPFLQEMQYDPAVPMTSVTVPTPETVSVNYWMNSLVSMRRAVMLAGLAGTGKTQIVNGMLGELNPEDCMATTINFNFYTTSAILQNTMALPLVKKTGTNYGPPGQARLIYFVDDVNLPEVDLYDTQSAIALLRQHMEYEHVYDLSKLTAKNISNTQLIACMNPTAGSFEVNPRLQRWFATFAIGLPETMSLHTIYLTFLTGHLKHFEPEIQALSKDLVKVAVNLHREVMNNFRKTATNFHYEFNIRHLSNVFQGLLVSQPDQFKQPERFVHLWLHESERVYGDRLVSNEDLAKFNQIVQSQAKKVFPQYNFARFYSSENADPLIVCHFAQGLQDKIYDVVSSMASMSKTLEDALREYNEINANMDLVLFDDALKHVARVVRIVMNVGGHALLVGVGGSGKQSLSRLAAFICNYTVRQIVISSTYGINDLKEDLKSMYNRAGLKEEGVMFLLTDSQITNERFLIFINDLLASGNIPDLFGPDEVDAIVNAVVPKVKALGKVPDRNNCWDYFIHQIKRNLHVVLAFSPVGADFRSRARKFPAIVNCTVIDWFQPWPKEALFSVGKRFLSDADLGDQSVRSVIEQFLPYSFDEVNRAAARFRNQERRYVYTTPKSYLELLKLYHKLLDQKRQEADSAIERLRNGLAKLKETGDAVAKLEEELKVALEAAEQKKTVAEGIAENVAREKATVEIETANAQAESEQVATIQAEVSIKQRDTEEDLAKAEPAVLAAMQALDTLDRKDLGECRTMSRPPAGVDDIFAATMILLAGVHPGVVVQKTGKVKDRSWDAAKKQLLTNTAEYIDYLKGIKDAVDQNRVPAINWREIRPLLELEHFNPEAIMTKNRAAAGLCSFVLNIVSYYDIVTTVEPKRQALAAANAELDAANTRLQLVTAQVAELEARLAKLTEEFEQANKEKQEALDTVAKGERKLNLAQRLTSALASENERWAHNVVTLEHDKELLTGDVLLASAFISYVGPFTKPFRDQLMNQVFVPFLSSKLSDAVGPDGTLPLSTECNPIKILTSDAEIAVWNQNSLPADSVSIENGAIASNSARWPLMIDPQLQGIKWMRAQESNPERNLQVVRLGQSDLLRKLEQALENGHSILIENIGESIDAVLNPVIQRATIKRGHKHYLKLGDSEVEFHPKFKLILHTKLSNPHYPPEVQAETTLINFTVTQQGLEDQLLALVVYKERPELAKMSEKLVEQQNGFKIKMKELEDNILFRLATAQGDITEDRELIEGLEETKRIAMDIQQKSTIARETQEKILVTSEKYRPVANRAALLFFMMSELVKIHTYYIYSLAAFTQVFYRGIELVSKPSLSKRDTQNSIDVEGQSTGDAGEAAVTEAAAPERPDGEDNVSEEDTGGELSNQELADRCDQLIKSITDVVFDYTRRGLFERDKMMVATLLTLRVCVNDGLLSQEEVDYLVMGKVAPDPGNMGPLHEWLPESVWPKVKGLEGLKWFASLGDNMQSDSDEWWKWFDSEQPEVAKLPGEYQKTLDEFERIVLLRAMRPDRVSAALRVYISKMMGPNYVYQQPFDMPKTYKETAAATPMFFVLFPGVDPTPWVEGLAATLGISISAGNFKNISMGQGQERPAEAIVERFAKEGGWVMLQNCHLMQSWLPKLERLLEVVTENAHERFRCFLSAEPPPLASMKNMPESLMQTCIKVSNEAPSDIKSNLTRGWANFNQARIDNCPKGVEFQACLFSLCWFHSIVLGRRRFGQQGWSRAYSFNTGDLVICANVLETYILANDAVPWDDLRYIFGEIMYGGHITDAWDRRTNNSYLQVLFNEGLFSGLELGPGFPSPDPHTLDYEGYLTYVDEKLPPESPPQFGLHPNAEIGYLTQSTDSLFKNILTMAGSADQGAGGGRSATKDTMELLMKQLPENLNWLEIQEKAKPLLAAESGPFIVVALQECTRINMLLNEMRRSLVELDKGLKGQLSMSQAMEDLLVALSRNEWPGRDPFSLCRWESLAWPSRKSLVPQFNDLQARMHQLLEWTAELVTPFSVWLPGLFNPTSYLTAVMQVTARRTGAPLDQMTTETHVTMMAKPSDATYYPQDGAFVHGLYIEGARWPTPDEILDTEDISGTTCAGHLVDSRLKELLPPLPVIYVKAVPVQPTWEPSSVGYLRHDPNVYDCPVYITSFRGPTYVFLATLNTVDSNTKWVLAGTAILMQADN